MKVLSEEEATAILEQRERLALEELREIGFRISLYEPRRHVAADPLMGEAGGWKVGVCYAVATSTTGKRKTISGQSATQALAEAKGWCKYQLTQLSPELRFDVLLPGKTLEPQVFRRVAGDTAQTAARREATTRRVLSFEGTPHAVDALGNELPSSEANAPASASR